MAAVLGLDTARVEAACREAQRGGGVVVAANLNAPDQIVISGDPPAVARAGEVLQGRGAKRVIPLKVSGAFHSPLMAPAVAGPSARRSTSRDWSRARLPGGRERERRAGADGAGRRGGLLAAQLTSPVRWVESCRRLARGWRRAPRSWRSGPGSVLSGLAKRIVAGRDLRHLGTAAEVDSLPGWRR